MKNGFFKHGFAPCAPSGTHFQPAVNQPNAQKGSIIIAQIPAQVRRIALFMGFKPPCEVDDFTPPDCKVTSFTLTPRQADSFTAAANAAEQASYQALLDELAEIKQRLDNARSHFEFETDFDLIEADIFHIRELEARFGHTMKQIKASYRMLRLGASETA